MSQTISVLGMTCGHCEQRVEEALEEIEGIDSATADRTADSVTIEGSADTEALAEAVEAAGYELAA